MKKHPHWFIQAIISVSNFRLNRPFMLSLKHPGGFWSIYAPGVGTLGSKIRIFKKWKKKKTTNSFKSAKFQTDLTMYGFPRVLP